MVKLNEKRFWGEMGQGTALDGFLLSSHGLQAVRLFAVDGLICYPSSRSLLLFRAAVQFPF